MRFLTVRANAFGPFSPNETLDLKPGFNIVYGPNEAGKSSWHAALYAGFCGIRRGQGRPSPEDQLFAQKHRPWRQEEAADWVVTTIVELQDGRRLELRHDLVTRTATLSDPELGRPFEEDIVFEGAPDGSRLLGLDRRAFSATACVGQAELLQVRESSERLQEYLQRAVATGREDATVVGALTKLDGYHDVFVGSERAPKKPWRIARDSVDRLTIELERVERAHIAHLELTARGEDALEESKAAKRRLDLVLARQAILKADQLRGRLLKAKELNALFPQGAPPGILDDGELANLVGIALDAWNRRPTIPTLTGPTASAIRSEIESLPEMPEGDLEPHAIVQAARDNLRDATISLVEHTKFEPESGTKVNSGGLSEDDLRQLAFDLQQMGEDRPAPRTEGMRNAGVIPVGIFSVGVLFSLLGLLLLSSSSLVGGLLLLAGLIAAASGILLFVRAQSRNSEDARRETQTQLRLEAREQIRKNAEAQVVAAGLPANAAQLQELADNVAANRSRQRERDAWEGRQSTLKEDLVNRQSALREALAARGAEASADLLGDVEGYVTACHDRRRTANEAQKRTSLVTQLEAREAAEESAEAALELGRQAEEGIRQTSKKLGISGAGPEQMVDALKVWMDQREARLGELESQQGQWSELRQLLGGRSLGEIEAELETSRSQVESLTSDLPTNEIEATSLESDVESQVARLRAAYQELAGQAAELQGQIKTEGQRVPSVPVAKEDLAAAQAEFERVSRLRDTISKTKHFLEVAEDRVNRDIAPILNESVGRRLAEVTRGRYSEVRVDPEDLTVRVQLSDGSLQAAHLLSHGTAEQIYLLLRVAMAERLTKPDEVCPLILDDVTVQSDSDRTQSILETLKAVSLERQVIFFSQEEEVLTWAQANLLEGDRNQLKTLDLRGRGRGLD